MKAVFLTALLMMGSGMAAAEDQHVPLAVTGDAHVTEAVPQNSGELKKSVEDLDQGMLSLKRNQFQAAIDEISDSVRLAPNARNYEALGTAYYQAGDDAKAAWAYRQSLLWKPNARLQKLTDALERGQRRSGGGEEDRLLHRAASSVREGHPDQALEDYLQAFHLKGDLIARHPIASLAAALTKKDLKDNDLGAAIRVLVQSKAVYEHAADLTREEAKKLTELAAYESRVVALTGESLQDHALAMQRDPERWQMKIRSIETAAASSSRNEH